MIKTIEKRTFNFIKTEWCSNWLRLKRSLAINLKYIEFLKSKVKRLAFSPIVEKENLDKAEKLLLQKAQWEIYEDDLVQLSLNGQVSKNSTIKNLNPQVIEGLLRARGRLANICYLSDDVKQPIILPKRHHVTELIIQHYHERYMHKKMEAVIAAIRQRFWVIDLRAVVRSVISKCQRCKNERARPIAPMMAPLPESRAAVFKKPFTHTGVDYFGPMTVSIGRRVEKRWGAIFTCMTTRAIHLEIAKDLSTNSFIMCLKNVQHRRGKICHIYSDNGTNFVGANRQITELIERCATNGIKWHFNPPAAPHFGGVWERMVREVKSLLPNNDNMPEEVLRSVFIEIEFILNNRPLTHIPLETEDDEPLTPFHFLIGCSGEAEPTPAGISAAEASTNNWKKAQVITQNYWERWLKEYLPTLAKREKWIERSDPIQPDDIVVFPDEQRVGRWLKGRAVEVYPAKDGQVRSAKIKVENGEYKRPVINLSVLEVKGKKIADVPSWGVKRPVNIAYVKKLAEQLKTPPAKRRKHLVKPYNGPVSMHYRPVSRMETNRQSFS
uniref:uncharacterized protein LOC125906437 isoform X2 n=1 Tax=Anopheles coluzzii TaxID=1518534 RepID=UPI0020FFA978|nr:uncharacterized protein LOC125906437 isoform X2 [Anopheles coluzzii]